MTYHQLRLLDKNSLVNIGLERIRESLNLTKAHTNLFDKVSVFANDEEIKIDFLNPIKFIPINAEFYYDITVQLVDNCTSYSIYANGNYKKTGLETPFFIHSPESENAIQFVIAAINKPHGINEYETRKDFLKDFDGELIIRDHKDYYDITRTSAWQESWYKINKQSGEIYDDAHAHLEPAPDVDESKYVEIT